MQSCSHQVPLRVKYIKHTLRTDLLWPTWTITIIRSSLVWRLCAHYLVFRAASHSSRCSCMCFFIPMFCGSTGPGPASNLSSRVSTVSSSPTGRHSVDIVGEITDYQYFITAICRAGLPTVVLLMKHRCDTKDRDWEVVRLKPHDHYLLSVIIFICSMTNPAWCSYLLPLPRAEEERKPSIPPLTVKASQTLTSRLTQWDDTSGNILVNRIIITTLVTQHIPHTKRFFQ